MSDGQTDAAKEGLPPLSDAEVAAIRATPSTRRPKRDENDGD